MALPADVLAAMVVRNEIRDALAKAEANLQAALKPHAGETFELEGVPFKVCGGPPRGFYLRRFVSADEAAALRAKWRSE